MMILTLTRTRTRTRTHDPNRQVSGLHKTGALEISYDDETKELTVPRRHVRVMAPGEEVSSLVCVRVDDCLTSNTNSHVRPHPHPQPHACAPSQRVSELSSYFSLGSRKSIWFI